jgi:diguanylate cyclase (GGDEF)-like protein
LILISLQIVWLAFSNIKENKNREMIGSVFVLYIFVSTMRVIATVLGERGNDYFVNDATDGFFLIFYQMMTVLLTYSIVLTINKRLFAEIEVQSEEREKMLIKLNHLATIDGLTNVFNRMKIEDVLNAEIARFKRYGHAFSIMLIDIDHFKIVNDTYGHPQGDHVLTEMAELLRRNLRGTDYIGRWGGDEFLIITPGSSIGETKTLAQKLLTASSNYEYIQEMTVTMSIGISTIREGISEKELIIDADKALYMAKANGRNMIEVGI